MDKFRMSANILLSAFGKAGDPYMCKEIHVENFDLAKTNANKFRGVIVYFNLDMLYEFLRPKTTERKILRILNRTVKIIHHEISCLRGKVYSYDIFSYYAVWKFEDDFSEKEFPSTISNDDVKSYFKNKMTSKVEVAFSALFIASFKVKIFIREYMHYKHNKINMKAEHTVGFLLHVGTGFEGLQGSVDKVDIVAFGRDLSIAKELSRYCSGLKSDILVTEYAYHLLTEDVGPD